MESAINFGSTGVFVMLTTDPNIYGGAAVIELDKIELTRDEVADELNQLAQFNIDSAEGFRAAAREIDNDSLTGLFEELAEQRQCFANDLRRLTATYGREPVEGERSAKATLHQWWLKARARLTSDGPRAVLEEAERGEDQIVQAYEQSLANLAGDSTQELIVAQYEQIKQGHNRVKVLRDVAKAA